MIFGGLKNLLGRNHHAKIDHLEVITLKHHRHNILANVMHIALNRGNDDLALGLCVARGLLFSLNVRNKMRNRSLHHPG